MNAPIDRTHAESLAAIAAIRRQVTELRAAAAAWTPRPYTVQVRG